MLTRYADALQLTSRADWHPYPRSDERDFWKGLPDAVRQRHVHRGERALEFTWPALPATLFLGVARTGNRSDYERAYFERRSKVLDLVLAECFEGSGRFVDAAADGIWALCEESYWGVPAHVDVQHAGRTLPDTAEPTVDLFAAETASLLAYAGYLIGPQLDQVSPLIGPRIGREIDHRILTPNLERDDFWWMGFADPARRPNNWNPWINSNWLACVLLVEPDPERRLTAVRKIMSSLDTFIDPYPADGGCDEGPSYWGRAAASMFDCLELLDLAAGIDVFGEPLVQEMGRFVDRAQVAEDYFVNFADAPAILRPDASLIFRYGRRIDDPDLAAMGAWEARRQGLFDPPAAEEEARARPHQSLARELPALASLQAMAEVEPYAPLPRDTWLPVIEVMTARDEARTPSGFYVAAKGGHNAESHNHNDIGQFVVFIEGLPVLIDAGVETYTMKTFSDRRYEIWTMQSAYHNLLPTIDGVMQSPGAEFAARDVSYAAHEDGVTFSLDLAGAYPAEAGLQTWLRTVRLVRGQRVEIADAYTLDHAPRALTLSLLTPCAVESAENGVITLGTRTIVPGRDSGAATITYDASKLASSVEVVPIDDPQLRAVWGEQLFRMIFAAKAPSERDSWALRVTR